MRAEKFSSKKSLSNRLISSLLITVFLCLDIFPPSLKTSYAQNLMGVAEDQDSHSLNANRITPENMANLALPLDLGTLESVSRAKSGDKWVVLIQDAHSVPEAQKSILGLVEYFQKVFGIGLVSLEGASGKLDTTLFKSFPDPEKLGQVFESYLSLGELSGAAAAAVLSPNSAKYYGVEDAALYEKAVRAFLESLPMRPIMLDRAAVLSHTLEKLKAVYYSEKLKSLDQKRAAFEEDEEAFESFLSELLKHKNTAGITAGKYPHLSLIFDEISLTNEQRENLNQEIRRIAQQINPALNEDESKQYSAHWQAFQLGQAAPEVFLTELAQIAEKKQIRLKLSSEAALQINRSAKIKNMRAGALFDELRNFADAVSGRLADTDEAKAVLELSSQLDTLKRLVLIKLTRQDWEFLNRENTPPSAVGPEIKTAAEAVTQFKSGLIREYPAYQFYQLSCDRDAVMAERLTRWMADEKQNAAILVTGGFHARALGEMLEAKNISYAVVLPKMTSTPKENTYEDHMKGNTSWRKYLQAEHGRLDIYSAFIKAASEQLLNVQSTEYSVQREGFLGTPHSVRSTQLKHWRDQLIRDLSRKGKLSEAHLYTAHLDRLTWEGMKDSERKIAEREWRIKLDHLTDVLEAHKSDKDWSAGKVMDLVGKTTATAWTAVPFVRGTFYAEDLLSAGETAVSAKSEVRKNEPNSQAIKKVLNDAARFSAIDLKKSGNFIPSAEDLRRVIRKEIFNRANWKDYSIVRQFLSSEGMHSGEFPVFDLARAIREMMVHGKYSLRNLNRAVEWVLEDYMDYSDQGHDFITHPLSTVIHEQVVSKMPSFFIDETLGDRVSEAAVTGRRINQNVFVLVNGWAGLGEKAARSELRHPEKQLTEQLSKTSDALDWYRVIEELREIAPKKNVSVTVKLDRGIEAKIPFHEAVFQDIPELAYRYLAAWVYNASIIYGTSTVRIQVNTSAANKTLAAAAGMAKRLLGEKTILKVAPLYYDDQFLSAKISALLKGDLSNVRDSLEPITHSPYGINNYANAGKEVTIVQGSGLNGQAKISADEQTASAVIKNKGIYLGIDIGGGSSKWGLIVDGEFHPLPAELKTQKTEIAEHENGSQYVLRVANRAAEIQQWAKKNFGREIEGVGIVMPGAADIQNNRMATLGQIPNVKKWSDKDIETVWQLTHAVAHAMKIDPKKAIVRNDMDGVLSGVAGLLPNMRPEFWKKTKGNFAFNWMGTGHGFQFSVKGTPFPGPTEAGHMMVDFKMPGQSPYDTEARTSIPNLIRVAKGLGFPKNLTEVKPIGDAAANDSHPLHWQALRVFKEEFAHAFARNAAVIYLLSQFTGETAGSEVLLGGGIARGGTGTILKELTSRELTALGFGKKISIEILPEEEVTRTIEDPNDFGPLGAASLIQAHVQTIARAEARADFENGLLMITAKRVADWKSEILLFKQKGLTPQEAQFLNIRFISARQELAGYRELGMYQTKDSGRAGFVKDPVKREFLETLESIGLPLKRNGNTIAKLNRLLRADEEILAQSQKRSEVRSSVESAPAVAVDAQAKIKRAFDLKEAARARAAWVYRVNRDMITLFENYKREKSKSPEDAAAKIQAIKAYAAEFEALSKRIAPDAESRAPEKENHLFEEIDQQDYDTLKTTMTSLGHEIKKKLIPQIAAAYQARENTKLEELSQEAVFKIKARIKAQIRRILFQLRLDLPNETALLSQVIALSEAYLKQLANEYSWRYRRAVAQAGTEKIKLVGRFGIPSETYDYSAFRIFVPEKNSESDKKEEPEVTITRNYWERVEIGPNSFTYQLKPRELKISGLDRALRLEIHTLVSLEQDYSYMLFHINSLDYVRELLKDHGQNLAEYQRDQITANLGDVLWGEAGLAKPGVRVKQKLQGASNIRAVMADIANGKTEEAIGLLDAAISLLEERKRDLEDMRFGIAKHADYITHEIRREETSRAMDELEGTPENPGLLAQGKDKEALDLLELLYKTYYQPISSSSNQYTSLKVLVTRMVQNLRRLTSPPKGDVGIVTIPDSLFKDLREIKLKVKSRTARSDLRSISETPRVEPEVPRSEVRGNERQAVTASTPLKAGKTQIWTQENGVGTYQSGNFKKTDSSIKVEFEDDRGALYTQTFNTASLKFGKLFLATDADIRAAEEGVEEAAVAPAEPKETKSRQDDEKALSELARDAKEILKNKRFGSPMMTRGDREKLEWAAANKIPIELAGIIRMIIVRYQKALSERKKKYYSLDNATVLERVMIAGILKSIKVGGGAAYSSSFTLRLKINERMADAIKNIQSQLNEKGQLSENALRVLIAQFVNPKTQGHFFKALADRRQENPQLLSLDALIDNSVPLVERILANEFPSLNIHPRPLVNNPYGYTNVAAESSETAAIENTADQETQEARSENRFKTQDDLILNLTQNWEQIKRSGFFAFDMQKTLADRKQKATPEMRASLAWLLQQGMRVVINSGNTEKEVMDQVVNGLAEELKAKGRPELLSQVTIYSNSGTLKTTFNEKGERQEHPDYQRRTQLDQRIEAPIKNALIEAGRNKFFITDETEMKRLQAMYQKDEEKSGGKPKFIFPWKISGEFEPAIVDENLPETELAGPYIQRRSFVPGGYATKIGITRFLPEKRPQVVELITKSIEESLGKTFLDQVTIGLGGESTIDIVSVNASKALALVDYVQSERAAGRPVDLEYAYFGGDELTQQVHGNITGAEGVHAGNDAIVLTHNYADPEFKKIKGIAVTPELPVGFDDSISSRVYAVGGEHKGMEAFFNALRQAIEPSAARSDHRSISKAPLVKPKVSRSEVRSESTHDRFLFGLHEDKPDWWTMRVLGASLLTAFRVHKTDTVTFDQIKELALPRLQGAGLPDEDMTDKKLESLLYRIQNELKHIHKIDTNQWKVVPGAEKLLATQTAAVDIVMDDLLEVLERFEKGDAAAADYFYDLMRDYATASEHWHLFETEARWAVEKAFEMLLKKDQKILIDILKKAPEDLKNRRLVDAVLRLISKEVPEDWAKKMTPHLVGSTIFYISPETWLAAGGLGRVGQYHTVKMQELMGKHADVATIESYYWKPDPNKPGEFIPIDYSGVAVPVKDLRKETEFEIRVNKKGQRINVTVEIFKGTNDKGIQVYMLRDKPEAGQAPYFVKQLYKYTERKNMGRDSASRSEYIEFMSKASLKLVKKLNKKIREEKQASGRPYAPPVIWNNDGQSIPTSAFKRISDVLENFTPEQKKLILTEKQIDLDQLAEINPQAFEKVKISLKEDQNRLGWLIEELRDLVQAEDEDSLLDAVTHSTTHTYLNRGWEPFNDLMREWAIPKAFYWLFDSVIYKGQADPSRALAAADTKNGVAASHAQEVGPAHNPESTLIGIANGDHLEATQAHLVKAANLVVQEHPEFKGVDLDEPPAEFIPIVKEKSKELWIENLKKLLTAQIEAEKDQKKKAALKEDLAVVGELSTRKPTGSYSGRAQGEKVDLLEVFTLENLRQWAADGAQIVPYGNVQANIFSEELYAELKRRQNIVNEEARKPGNEHWGRVLIVDKWNQDEQKYLMAASDFSIYVSERNFKSEKWGTEAAGRTEANYALFYAMNITAPYIEGLFTVEGAIRDRNHPGRGNIILSPRHEAAFYRKTVSQLIADWKEAFIEKKTLKEYAADLIAGRKMSLVLDAGMPAAQYSWTFNEAMGIKLDPVGSYLRALSNGTQDELANEIWFREDLIRALRNGKADGKEISDHFDDKARLFTAELNGKHSIVAVAEGYTEKNQNLLAKIGNTHTHAMSELLIQKMGLNEKDQVRIKDAQTGQDYGVHPVSNLIGYGIYGIDINLSGKTPVKVFTLEKAPVHQRIHPASNPSAVVAKAKFLLQDGFKLFTPSKNPFEFWRSVQSFIGSADSGLAGFIHAYHRLRREKPQEMMESLRHHASRGDIFNYVIDILKSQKQSGLGVLTEIEKLKKVSDKASSEDEKIRINLIALDLIDRYLRWMAGQMIETYVNTPQADLYDASKTPTDLERSYQNIFYQTPFTKYVGQYLESSHTSAKKLPTSKQGIQNYIFEKTDGKIKTISINVGAVSYPDQGMNKAWGKIPYRGFFKQLVDELAETPGAGWQVSDAKSGVDFGFYLPGELEMRGLSVGVPGIQVLELSKETDEALIHAADHRGKGSDWQEVKLVAEAIKRAAFDHDLKRLERLLPSQKKVAEKIYPPNLLPSLMGLIAGLVPDYLDKVKEWNPEAYSVLRKTVDQNTALMRNGKLVFNETGREEGVFNFSYSINGSDDQNIVFHIELDHSQYSKTDKKSWTVVRLNKEGINLQDESLYRVHGLIEDLIFNPKTGKHLKRHWDIGVPASEEVKDPESGTVIQHPWGFGIYRLEPYDKNQFPTPPVVHPAQVSHEVQKPEDLQVFEFNARAYFEEIGIKSFDEFSDERIKEIAEMGFNALWVMGIYKISQASKELNLRYEDSAHPGRRPSAFAIPDYVINPDDLGGDAAYRRFVERAKKLGVRVMADFIPNHVAKDSPLIALHPDWFIHRVTPPAENEKNKYFKYVLPNGKTIWVAHGTDGGGPWADTAVFNLLNPEVWQFFKETLFKLADLTQGGGIRADSLQVLFPKKYYDLWFQRAMLPANYNDHLKAISQLVFNRDPDAGNNVFGALFATVKESYPDFKIIGEIYEDQHGDWQQSGVDITYAKYVYNWIVNGEPLRYSAYGREHVVEGWQTFKNMVLGRAEHQNMTLEYMLRSYYFLEDHDQRIRILEKLRQRLGKQKVDTDVIEWSKLLATAIATIPGVPQVYMGQQEGRSRIIDSPDWFPPQEWVAKNADTKFDELPGFYRNLYKITQQPVFRRGSRPEEIPHTGGNGGELVFIRRYQGKAGVVVLNHSSQTVTLKLDLSLIGQESRTVTLKPWQALQPEVVEDKSIQRSDLRSVSQALRDEPDVHRSEVRASKNKKTDKRQPPSPAKFFSDNPGTVGSLDNLYGPVSFGTKPKPNITDAIAALKMARPEESYSPIKQSIISKMNDLEKLYGDGSPRVLSFARRELDKDAVWIAFTLITDLAAALIKDPRIKSPEGYQAVSADYLVSLGDILENLKGLIFFINNHPASLNETKESLPKRIAHESVIAKSMELVTVIAGSNVQGELSGNASVMIQLAKKKRYKKLLYLIDNTVIESSNSAATETNRVFFNDFKRLIDQAESREPEPSWAQILAELNTVEAIKDEALLTIGLMAWIFSDKENQGKSAMHSRLNQYKNLISNDNFMQAADLISSDIQAMTPIDNENIQEWNLFAGEIVAAAKKALALESGHISDDLNKMSVEELRSLAVLAFKTYRDAFFAGNAGSALRESFQDLEKWISDGDFKSAIERMEIVNAHSTDASRVAAQYLHLVLSAAQKKSQQIDALVYTVQSLLKSFALGVAASSVNFGSIDPPFLIKDRINSLLDQKKYKTAYTEILDVIKRYKLLAMGFPEMHKDLKILSDAVIYIEQILNFFHIAENKSELIGQNAGSDMPQQTLGQIWSGDAEPETPENRLEMMLDVAKSTEDPALKKAAEGLSLENLKDRTPEFTKILFEHSFQKYRESKASIMAIESKGRTDLKKLKKTHENNLDIYAHRILYSIVWLADNYLQNKNSSDYETAVDRAIKALPHLDLNKRERKIILITLEGLFNDTDESQMESLIIEADFKNNLNDADFAVKVQDYAALLQSKFYPISPENAQAVFTQIEKAIERLKKHLKDQDLNGYLQALLTMAVNFAEMSGKPENYDKALAYSGLKVFQNESAALRERSLDRIRMHSAKALHLHQEGKAAEADKILNEVAGDFHNLTPPVKNLYLGLIAMQKKEYKKADAYFMEMESGDEPVDSTLLRAASAKFSGDVENAETLIIQYFTDRVENVDEKKQTIWAMESQVFNNPSNLILTGALDTAEEIFKNPAKWPQDTRVLANLTAFLIRFNRIQGAADYLPIWVDEETLAKGQPLGYSKESILTILEVMDQTFPSKARMAAYAIEKWIRAKYPDYADALRGFIAASAAQSLNETSMKRSVRLAALLESLGTGFEPSDENAKELFNASMMQSGFDPASGIKFFENYGFKIREALAYQPGVDLATYKYTMQLWKKYAGIIGDIEGWEARQKYETAVIEETKKMLADKKLVALLKETDPKGRLLFYIYFLQLVRNMGDIKLETLGAVEAYNAFKQLDPKVINEMVAGDYGYVSIIMRKVESLISANQTAGLAEAEQLLAKAIGAALDRLENDQDNEDNKSIHDDFVAGINQIGFRTWHEIFRTDSDLRREFIRYFSYVFSGTFLEDFSPNEEMVFSARMAHVAISAFVKPEIFRQGVTRLLETYKDKEFGPRELIFGSTILARYANEMSENGALSPELIGIIEKNLDRYDLLISEQEGMDPVTAGTNRALFEAARGNYDKAQSLLDALLNNPNEEIQSQTRWIFMMKALTYRLEGQTAKSQEMLARSLPEKDFSQKKSKPRLTDALGAFLSIHIYITQNQRQMLIEMFFDWLKHQDAAQAFQVKEMLSIVSHLDEDYTIKKIKEYLNSSEEERQWDAAKDFYFLEWLSKQTGNESDAYLIADSFLKKMIGQTKTDAQLKKLKESLESSLTAEDFKVFTVSAAARGDYKAALELIERGLRKSSKLPELSEWFTYHKNVFAKILAERAVWEEFYKQGDLKSALALAAKFMTVHTNDPQARQLLSNMESMKQAVQFLAAGEWQQAKKILEQIAPNLRDKNVKNMIKTFESIASAVEMIEHAQFEAARPILEKAVENLEGKWRVRIPRDKGGIQNLFRRIEQWEGKIRGYENIIKNSEASMLEVKEAAVHLAAYPEKTERAFKVLIQQAVNSFNAKSYRKSFNLARLVYELAADYPSPKGAIYKAKEVMAQSAVQIWLPQFEDDLWIIHTMIEAERHRDERERQKLGYKGSAQQIEFEFEEDSIEFNEKGFRIKKLTHKQANGRILNAVMTEHVWNGDTFQLRRKTTAADREAAVLAKKKDPTPEPMDVLFKVVGRGEDYVQFELPKTREGYDDIREQIEKEISSGGVMIRTDNKVWVKQKNMLEKTLKDIKAFEQKQLDPEKSPANLPSTGNKLLDQMLGFDLEFPAAEAVLAKKAAEENAVRLVEAKERQIQQILAAQTPEGAEIPKFAFDDSQKEALIGILTHPVVLLQGPPGTGKTTMIQTAIEMLYQDFAQGVIVSSQQNHAVDHVAQLVLDKEKELAKTPGLKNAIGWKPVAFARVGSNDQMITNQEIAENQKRRVEILKQMWDDHRFKKGFLIFGTANGLPLDSKLLINEQLLRSVNTLIMDESTRATREEAMLLMTLPQLKNLKKIVFVGDPFQLPAYGISEEDSSFAASELGAKKQMKMEGRDNRSLDQIFDSAKMSNFRISLFEKSLDLFLDNDESGKVYTVTRPPFYYLDVQRRSGTDIVEMINYFYKGRRPLKAGNNYYGDIIVDDTAKKSPEAHEGEKEDMLVNYGEVNRVLYWVNDYINKRNYSIDDFAVITPYKGQLQRISTALTQFAELHQYLINVETNLPAELNAGILDSKYLFRWIDSRSEGETKEQVLKGKRNEILNALRHLQRSGNPEQARALREKLGLGEKFIPLSELSKGKFNLVTIDSSIGNEWKAVILSLVRSNTEGSIGFLGNSEGLKRRNVGFSRGKERVTIIGDLSGTFVNAYNPEVRRWTQHILGVARTNAKHRSENPNAARSEVRKAAGSILKNFALREGRILAADAERLAGLILDFGAGDVAYAMREEGKNPVYPKILSGASIYANYREQIQFMNRHADYDARRRQFTGSFIEQARSQAHAYLQNDESRKLSFAYAYRVGADTSESLRGDILASIRLIKALKNEYPSRVRGSIKILAPSFLAKSSAFAGFIKEAESSGVAKMIWMDKPGAQMELARYLEENPNALVYGRFDSEMVPQKFIHRYVDSKVSLESAFPVTLTVTVGLAASPKIKAEELRKALPDMLPGVIRFNGTSFEITAAALELIYHEQQVAQLLSRSA